MINQKQIQPLYSEKGDLVAVCISAEKWLSHQDELEQILLGQPKKPAASPEPMGEWKTFLSYWDFNYPVEKCVECKRCGNYSQDWTSDTPRKFTLRTASLGGLVAFVCQECSSRVSKKHFKDHILYESGADSCKV